ncbi:unnamed protein product [Owenia fusiformis]|uniref:C2H2-type domain-containing protein n=1 Tax=Owenia fusiformis TaxID=6347 RepID=A0A8S4NKK0_OWEFU|nr:unnamed protein product [Owenia fusiformis]
MARTKTTKRKYPEVNVAEMENIDPVRYPCLYCDKSFTRRTSLKRHLIDRQAHWITAGDFAEAMECIQGGVCGSQIMAWRLSNPIISLPLATLNRKKECAISLLDMEEECAPHVEEDDGASMSNAPATSQQSELTTTTSAPMAPDTSSLDSVPDCNDQFVRTASHTPVPAPIITTRQPIHAPNYNSRPSVIPEPSNLEQVTDTIIAKQTQPNKAILIDISAKRPAPAASPAEGAPAKIRRSLSTEARPSTVSQEPSLAHRRPGSLGDPVPPKEFEGQRVYQFGERVSIAPNHWELKRMEVKLVYYDPTTRREHVDSLVSTMR